MSERAIKMAQSIGEFFAGLESQVDSSKIAGMNAVYQFDISGDGGGQWNVALADGNATVAEGTHESPSITISASDENWSKIVAGELNGQTAFLTGKLKIKGDMSLAMKLQSVFSVG